MQHWQRNARWVIAVFGVVFAVFVARELKRRNAPPAMTPVVRADPGAVVETTGGHTTEFKGTREDVSVAYQKQFLYEDGSTRMLGVTVITDERHGNRTFTITGKEGRLGKNSTTMALDGAVKLEGSDGMHVLTEHATYAESDGAVRAPGPVEFTEMVRETGPMLPEPASGAAPWEVSTELHPTSIAIAQILKTRIPPLSRSR